MPFHDVHSSAIMLLILDHVIAESTVHLLFNYLSQDQLELHRPGVRFAKLELSGRLNPTV